MSNSRRPEIERKIVEIREALKVRDISWWDINLDNLRNNINDLYNQLLLKKGFDKEEKALYPYPSYGQNTSRFTDDFGFRTYQSGGHVLTEDESMALEDFYKRRDDFRKRRDEWGLPFKSVRLYLIDNNSDSVANKFGKKLRALSESYKLLLKNFKDKYAQNNHAITEQQLLTDAEGLLFDCINTQTVEAFIKELKTDFFNRVASYSQWSDGLIPTPSLPSAVLDAKADMKEMPLLSKIVLPTSNESSVAELMILNRQMALEIRNLNSKVDRLTQLLMQVVNKVPDMKQTETRINSTPPNVDTSRSPKLFQQGK